VPIIDEIGHLPISREQANLFFQTIAQALRTRLDDPHLQTSPSAVGIATSPATACSPWQPLISSARSTAELETS